MDLLDDQLNELDNMLDDGEDDWMHIEHPMAIHWRDIVDVVDDDVADFAGGLVGAMRFGAGGGVGGGVGNNNAWNNDSPAVFQSRMRELASRLPSVVLAESPTLRMYVAIQTNNMDQFKSSIEAGAIMENDFSHVSRHLHMLRDDFHGGGAGAAGQEARVTRKNPLEYAIDCVTVGAARQMHRTIEDFKAALLNDVNKHLMIEYPHFITKKFVTKLTMLLNYMASALISRHQNRHGQRGNFGWQVRMDGANGQDAGGPLPWLAGGGGANRNQPDPLDHVPDQEQNAPRQPRRRDFYMHAIFDDEFWRGVDEDKKRRFIENLYEAMFFPVEMKNIVNLDFFIKHGIDIGTYTANNGWDEEKTAVESILADFLLKIRAATNYVCGRTQMNAAQGDRLFHRRNRPAGTTWPREHAALFSSNYTLPIKHLIKRNIQLDIELHEFRINLMSDTFLGHAVTILNANVIRQRTIQNKLSDIHQAPNHQLSKLQDDFLKLSEINRLLAGAVESLVKSNVRLGLGIESNYKFTCLLATMAHFGILHSDKRVRHEFIVDSILRHKNDSSEWDEFKPSKTKPLHVPSRKTETQSLHVDECD